jgi:hypothetical protein
VSSDDAVIFRPRCRLEQRQSGGSRLLRCQDQALRFECHDDAGLGVVAGADLHGVIPVAVNARDVGPDRAVVAFGVPVVPVRRAAPSRAGGAHPVAVISCTVGLNGRVAAPPRGSRVQAPAQSLITPAGATLARYVRSAAIGGGSRFLDQAHGAHEVCIIGRRSGGCSRSRSWPALSPHATGAAQERGRGVPFDWSSVRR